MVTLTSINVASFSVFHTEATVNNDTLFKISRVFIRLECGLQFNSIHKCFISRFLYHVLIMNILKSIVKINKICDRNDDMNA